MPARLSALAKVLAEMGVTLEKPPSGSHWKLRRPGTRGYTVPAHNAMKTEITDEYINGCCRHFGLERELVWKRLRAKR